MSASENTSRLPPDIPPEVVPYLKQRGYLDADRLQQDSVAPDVPLFQLNLQATSLHGHLRGRPLALIFGSFT